MTMTLQQSDFNPCHCREASVNSSIKTIGPPYKAGPHSCCRPQSLWNRTNGVACCRGACYKARSLNTGFQTLSLELCVAQHIIHNPMSQNKNAMVTIYRLYKLVKSVSIVFPIYSEFHANSLNPTTNANKCHVHKVPYQTNLFQPICHAPVRNG